MVIGRFALSGHGKKEEPVDYARLVTSPFTRRAVASVKVQIEFSHTLLRQGEKEKEEASWMLVSVL